MDPPQYISMKTITQLFDVSAKTVRRMKDVKTSQTGISSNSKKLYCFEDLKRHFGEPTLENKIKRIGTIYCKANNAENVQKQLLLIQQTYPEHKVYSDVAKDDRISERKSFRKLLKHVSAGKIKEVVVLHKSILTICHLELLECHFADHNVCITEVDKDAEETDAESADMLHSIYQTLKRKLKKDCSVGNKKQKLLNLEKPPDML